MLHRSGFGGGGGGVKKKSGEWVISLQDLLLLLSY